MTLQILTQFSDFFFEFEQILSHFFSCRVLLHGLGSRHWCWKLAQGKASRALGFQPFVHVFMTPLWTPGLWSTCQSEHPLQWAPPSSAFHKEKIPKASGREDLVQSKGDQGETQAATEQNTEGSIHTKEKEWLHWRQNTVIHLTATNKAKGC